MCKLDILMFFFGWDRVQTSVLGQRLLWRRKGAAEIERPLFGQQRRYFTLLSLCLRRVRSEGSRNKSIVVAVGINFGAKNGMNQVFFVVIDHCVHIHTHINSFTHTYKIKLALKIQGEQNEKPDFWNDLAWDNMYLGWNIFLYKKNKLSNAIFLHKRTSLKTRFSFRSPCRRLLYSWTALPQSSKSN